MSKRRQIKTINVFFIVSLLTIFSLVGCNASTNPKSPSESNDYASEGEDVVITFSYYESYRSILEPLMAKFHQENPSITVQFVPLSETNYSEGATTEERLLALATGADTSLTSIRSSAMGAYFLDLQPLIDADSSFDQADFWSGSLSAMEDSQGRILGLPVTLFLRGIFYDKAVFDVANLSYPQPGWTWEDFQRTVSILTQKQADGVRYGYADRATLSILQPLIGYQLEMNDGLIDANALAAELAWYVSMAQDDQIFPLQETDNEAWLSLFQNDSYPAMWHGTMSEFLLGVTGEPEATDLISHFATSAYGFVPFPVAADGSNSNTTPLGAQYGVISAGTNYPLASWKWLKYLTEHWLISNQNDPQQQITVPSRGSVAEAVGFLDNFPSHIQPAVKYALEHAWFVGLNSQAEETVLKAVDKAAAGEGNLANALEDAEDQQASWPLEELDPSEIIAATPQSTPDGSQEAVTINFYYEGWTSQEEAAIRSSIYYFNQDHKGEIIVEASNVLKKYGAWEHYIGMSNDYDCYLSQVDPSGISASDPVLDLTAFLEAEDVAFQQDFDPAILNTSRYQDRLLALPLSIQPGVIVFNEDLLAERGLEPPSPDWTFDEFVGLITAVTSLTGEEKSYGLLTSSNAVGSLDLFLAGRNVQWRDTSGTYPTVMLNTPEMVDALIWFNEFQDTGVFYQFPLDQDWWSSISGAIQTGQIGFWSTRAGEQEDEFFNMRKPAFNVGIAPLPYTPKPNGPYEINYILGFYISSLSDSSEACWELGKYISEQASVLKGVPARSSVANSSAWEAQVGPENAAVYRAAVGNSLVEGADDPYNRGFLWIPVSHWLSNANSGIDDGKDPAQELALAQQYADAYLECMAPLDIAGLSAQELSEAANSCAIQVDPDY